MFPAHIRDGIDGKAIQTAEEHSRKTAKYAGESLYGAGLENAAALAGLVHDCGKFKTEFAEYIEGADGTRGSVNHTFAGFRLLMQRYHGETVQAVECVTAELLALAAGGHHGLFDCVNENKESGMLQRMSKKNIGYGECVANFHERCASGAELDKLFALAHSELSVIYDKLNTVTNEPEEYAFHLGLLSRLLLSAVIEGDRRDTAEFMNNAEYRAERGDMTEFWKPYMDRVEDKICELPCLTAVQKARKTISDKCREFAGYPGGIYRLNVPTGAGKTLSSLRYALTHAHIWGKRRIIYVSPLLSILEQNAAVIREYIGDDNIILEHHSNVIAAEEDGNLDLRELAIESWNEPVLITTMVQLLNTFFEGRTTAIRRFQGLCNSVIVIDEVQSVPPVMLSMFNLTLDFIAEICDATVVLCSATQPCFENTVHPMRMCKGDIIPYDKKIWDIFKRTSITDAGGRTLEEIAEFALENLNDVNSLLVVCNRKDEAEYLFNRLRNRADVNCHLSASMCSAHRRKTLAKLNAALSDGQKCLCVATQVIEAGVDISFERVIRLSAGMDSVVQAAGRCNRNGESDRPVAVYIVPCLDEKLGLLREIRDAKQATDSLLDAFKRNPERFDNDLASDKSISWYYNKLYTAMPKDYQDFCIKSKGVSLFELLSNNYKYYDEAAEYAQKYIMTQAFKTAGSLFSVFEHNTRDIVVPYGDGAKLIAELTGTAEPDVQFLSGWLKRVKPYTVTAYDWQIKKLGNAVREYAGVMLLSEGFYDDTGLTTELGGNVFTEV